MITTVESSAALDILLQMVGGLATDVLRTYRYEPATAARLIGLHPTRVRRWLFGYRFPTGKKREFKRQRPVVGHRPRAPRFASFLDLVELLSVKAFLEHGHSLQKVRDAHDEAAQLLKADHPFARRGYLVLDQSIFLELNPPGGSQILELLRGGQWVLRDVIVSLAERIEFDIETDLANRWWPLGRESPIVVDPRVAFGAPSIARHGIKTSVVYNLFLGEKRRIECVQRWLDLQPREIEAAVSWEEGKLAA